MMWKLLVLALALTPASTPGQELPAPPIIDMHLHANGADDNGPPPMGLCVPFYPQMPPLDPRETWEQVFMDRFRNPPCDNPIWSPTSDESMLAETIAVLERRNIIGLVSGPPELARLWASSSDRLVPALEFSITGQEPSPEVMRAWFEAGDFVVLGEVTNQYVGVAPDDERMVPYWALAEELDIPVAYHMAEGPPGAAHLFPGNRLALANPLLLEPVLARHPKLRVYVMHYGTPFIDEMIGMLQHYPQLYVDLGGIQWGYPREYFYAQLKQFIDAGYANRVMFGSDPVQWPGVIEPSIRIVEEAPFLTEEQKRDILYNNAARFLRLSEAEIARHHGN